MFAEGQICIALVMPDALPRPQAVPEAQRARLDQAPAVHDVQVQWPGPLGGDDGAAMASLTPVRDAAPATLIR